MWSALAADNLVRYELAAGGRTVLSQDHEIGDYNEVVRIRTGEGPDVSYEYDSAGRLTAARAGTRTANVAYDDLDRAVRVGLDGDTLATYDYARADAALDADRITSATPVPSGTPAVFGTMATVVYTRPAPMHFGPVAYELALRTFVATHRHLVPDAVLASSPRVRWTASVSGQSGGVPGRLGLGAKRAARREAGLVALDRRMLQWRGGDVDGRPFGTDKPSGSMFIPPEYRSVNCFVCTASLESASVSVSVAPVAGVRFNVLLGAGGTCMVDEGGSQGGGFGAPTGPSWHHSVTFGDGGSSSAQGDPATVAHTYASAGTYKVRTDVTCSPCQSIFVLGTSSQSVEVSPPPPPRPPTYTAKDIPVLNDGVATKKDDNMGRVEWDREPSTKIGCRAHGNGKYVLIGSVGLGETEIFVKSARRLDPCKKVSRKPPEDPNDNHQKTVDHEREHVAAKIAILNAANEAIGSVFDSFTDCNTAMGTWAAALSRRLNHEIDRQLNHCDHIGEPTQEIHCPGRGFKTGERNGPRYPNAGDEICRKTPAWPDDLLKPDN